MTTILRRISFFRFFEFHSRRVRKIQLIICFFLLLVPVSAQQKSPYVVFLPHDGQLFGFDAPQDNAWYSEYEVWENAPVTHYRIPVKSVGYLYPDRVDARIRHARAEFSDSIFFRIAGTKERIRSDYTGRGHFVLQLPPMEKDYVVEAVFGKKVIGQLKVLIYERITEKVIVVPLAGSPVAMDSLEEMINAVFAQALLSMDMTFVEPFSHEDWDSTELFDNPVTGHDRYTSRMRTVRELYFERFPDAPRDAYYVFIIPGFRDPSINGYAVMNKAMVFVKPSGTAKMARVIARQLSRGIGLLKDSWEEDGPARGSTENLMDWSSGTLLRRKQWEELRHGSGSYSLFDNYEDVRTSNGFVGYYFWEEDARGTIRLSGGDPLKSVLHPFKKNYDSYYLTIDNVLFRNLLVIGNLIFCAWHLIVFLLLIAAGWWGGRKLIRWQRNRYRSRLLRIGTRLGVLLLVLYACYGGYALVNLGYGWYEVKDGEVADYSGMKISEVVRTAALNVNNAHPSVKKMRSELLIGRKGKWYKHLRKPVLYFELLTDEEGKVQTMRLQSSSDSLVVSTKAYAAPALNHYVVFNYRGSNGLLLQQKVFNHLGREITAQLAAPDPPKRVLLFVNGYRPTSIGHTFEENFRDIMNKGLEFPDSRNLVYTFDRYDYWRPWQAIDLSFLKRINPVETFYADGHFSVATSNHGSLLNFTNTADIYPKRCPDPKHHTCYSVKSFRAGYLGLKSVSTMSLHRTKPNKSGFRERMKNGRIAGRNIYQALNELPNRSENDTLYIVAHSMGFAYSLGIVEELRGKIQFGGYYIIAPENAGAGRVDPDEWREVWQYGSHFGGKGKDAPCLQDGVAPQAMVSGLSSDRRIFIPKAFYNRKGFFDAHFIGYYTWIFNIPKGEKGHITRR